MHIGFSHDLVSLFWAGIGLTWIILAHRRRMARMEIDRDIAQPSHPADPETPSAQERELAALRSRVAVLERILTEDRHAQSVAAEIEALRHS